MIQSDSIDYFSIAVSLLITIFLYILYNVIFHSKDYLRLTYRYTAQNHVLTQNLPKEYQLPYWAKWTIFQILYSMGTWIQMRIDKEIAPYNETDYVPCAISDNKMLLHWRIHRKENGELEKKPAIVIFPGLTGNSSDAYLRTLILTLGHEYHVCVVNRIGSGESKLSDAKLTFMSNWESVDRVVSFVYEKMNGDAPMEEAPRPLFAVGYSLGGHNLLRWLTMSKFAPFKLHGAMTFSQIFDIASNTYRVEKSHPYYTRILTNNLVRFIKRNEEAYIEYEQSEEGRERGFSLERVYASKTIPDFDKSVAGVIHGMESILDDYYHPNSITDEALMNVSIPTLILHAEDDPVCTKEGLPLEAPMHNDNIIIGTTKYGGHCGFVQGGILIPSLNSFSDDLCHSFFNNILKFGKHYRYEVDEFDEE